MNVFIVRAHHEPKSYSSALADQAAKTLGELGHTVIVSDLNAQKFDPVSDRRNFTSAREPDYLKQQVEEAHATETHGFAPEIETEMRKLESADLLIFSFPLWWFGMPAILKGWVDRVFASQRIYGGGKLYENGLGQSRKRALILLTTGGGVPVYNGYGVNPPLTTILAPIQHGVFWFNGFLPLAPFVVYGPARLTQEERLAHLDQLDRRLRHLEEEKHQVLPPLSDFPNFYGPDIKKRFMATCSLAKTPDQHYQELVPQEQKRVAELKRMGVLVAAHIGNPAHQPWHAFLVFREASEDAVRQHLQTLPLAPYLSFEITELLPI